MTPSFDTWLDSTLTGRKPDAGEFARSAIGEVPRIETAIRQPNLNAWPPEVRREMQAILNGDPA